MKTKIILPFLALCFLFTSQKSISFCKPSDSSEVTIINLRTELKINPLGIDISNPRLSWELQSEERGTFQTAYEIFVSDNQEDLEKNNGDVWQTGKVKSNSTFGIVFTGKLLKSFIRYFWNIKNR